MSEGPAPKVTHVSVLYGPRGIMLRYLSGQKVVLSAQMTEAEARSVAMATLRACDKLSILLSKK